MPSITVCCPDIGRHKQCVKVVFSHARQLINIRGGSWAWQRVSTELLIQWCQHYTNIGWRFVFAGITWLTGSRIQDWRGVCLPTDKAVYNIIMTVFTRRRDVCIPTQHSTELLQTFTCVIDISLLFIQLFMAYLCITFSEQLNTIIS